MTDDDDDDDDNDDDDVDDDDADYDYDAILSHSDDVFSVAEVSSTDEVPSAGDNASDIHTVQTIGNLSDV